MVQAWDFVDASVLWGHRSDFLRVHVCDIDFGVCYTPRIMHACNVHDKLVKNETGLEWVPSPIVTVEDMVTVRPCEWLRVPNFGRRSLAAIERVLAEHGLTLPP
jgi:hypothetical protein